MSRLQLVITETITDADYPPVPAVFPDLELIDNTELDAAIRALAEMLEASHEQ